MFIKRAMPLWAPEGEAGGSGGSSDQGGSGKAAIQPSHDEATPGDKGEGGKKEAPARPEWAPEDYWDAEKGELKIEDLAKGYIETKKKVTMRTGDLEKKIKEDFEKGRLASRPESADKYELRLPENVPAEAWEWNEKDPLLGFARNLAFESGMGQDAFDKMVGAYVESEIAKLPDPVAEAKRLGEKGKERIERVDQWLSANVSRGAYAVLSKYTRNADMIVAVEELMQRAGAPAFVVTDGGGGGQDILTDAVVRGWMADPRYWDAGKRETAFVEKVDKAWKQLYPSTAGGGPRK